MNRGHKVKPKSIVIIRKVAQSIKDLFGIKDEYVPIVLLIELLHERGMLELEIQQQTEMLSDYGLSYPQRNKIIIREDVYNSAVADNGFSRFTLAHELGHLILHKQEFVLARNKHGGEHKVYEDSEWQADKFAQELLIDSRKVKAHYGVDDIKKKFVVSHKAASVAYRALIRELTR